jgi:ribosomal protein S18 acetylase RimI-like enzyme
VVGQRVVVRRVLPGETGPSGGPAMTDLLGVCTAWGEGRCVIAPEQGDPVEIRLADIVSGKPVPPRPSVRHRVGVRDAEQHTVDLWPHLETEPLGEWVLRSDPAPVGRLLKRANSCLAVGDPGTDLGTATARVRAFYEQRDRRVLAQVELGSEVDGFLAAAGWVPVPGGDAHFLMASLSRAVRTAGPAPDELLLEDDGREATAGLEGATGRAVLDGDWLGLHGLVVPEQQRRRGLGTSVVAGLLEWGAERGASTAWLHVEVDNDAALALYEGLGFRAHHTCRYLTPPT